MVQSHQRHYIALKWIVRLTGIVLLLMGVYRIAYSLFGSLFPFQPDYVRSVSPMIMQNPPQAFIDLAWQVTPLSYLSLGLVCFVSSFRRATLIYWSIQVAIWLIGISLWYRFNTFISPPQNPTWLIITGLCSLALLVAYKPAMSLLARGLPPSTYV